MARTAFQLPFSDLKNWIDAFRALWNAIRELARGKRNSCGTGTLTAGTTTTVAEALTGPNSHITITPTNTTSFPGYYISARSGGVSFTITHAAAAGTETFSYEVCA